MGNDFIEEHRGAPPESCAAPFRKAFSLRGRPESRLKWYFIWASRFAVFLPGSSFHLASREDAERFLSMLASSPGISDWQVEQAADALTILLGSVFGQEWARTIRIPDALPPPDSHSPRRRGATTGTRRSCSTPSGTRRAGRTSRNPSDATRCGIASPPTCWSLARTSARCRSSSVTATSQRR